MPDLISQLLPRLQENILPGLDLGDGFIYPQYNGGSILNIPSSICSWMNIPEIGEGPLISKILSPLGNGIQRVILILMDAISLHRLQSWMEDGTAPIWRSLMNDGLLAPLTSICPSTTSAALTTLWTGQSPSAHGIIGYIVWLKEFGVVANMILHAPITFHGDVGSLEKAGFNPEAFLPLPTLGPHLQQHGITPHSFQHKSIAHSGLSQMFMREVDVYPFSTPADLWISVRQLLESKPGERQYIWTYYGQVDHLSHHYGPDDERIAADFSQFSTAFEQFFLNKLSPAARKDTLVILTADHGQLHTPLRNKYVLKNHPKLNQHLHLDPTGESRLTYLFLRPSSEQFVRDYFASTWPGKFIFISADQALEGGLFGPSPHHPRLRDRIGDLIVIALDDAYLWWGNKADYLLGRHGGLSAHEMLVPFLGVRL